jgi:hypothetical protein
VEDKEEKSMSTFEKLSLSPEEKGREEVNMEA